MPRNLSILSGSPKSPKIECHAEMHICGQIWREIDNEGIRLTGCLNCNFWTARDGKEWRRLTVDELNSIRRPRTGRASRRKKSRPEGAARSHVQCFAGSTIEDVPRGCGPVRFTYTSPATIPKTMALPPHDIAIGVGAGEAPPYREGRKGPIWGPNTRAQTKEATMRKLALVLFVIVAATVAGQMTWRAEATPLTGTAIRLPCLRVIRLFRRPGACSERAAALPAANGFAPRTLMGRQRNAFARSVSDAAIGNRLLMTEFRGRRVEAVLLLAIVASGGREWQAPWPLSIMRACNSRNEICRMLPRMLPRC